MMRYSIQLGDRIFVKNYGFLSFAKIMNKNIDKNISKKVSGKYSQKVIDHTKQSAADAFKTASKGAVQKTAGATGDLVGNKIAEKITNVSRTSPQNNSETVTSEKKNIGLDREIPRERYISPEKIQKIIDDLRLIQLYNHGI